MKFRPRPKGLPRRIPEWAWKRLKRPGHKPQAGPHKLPFWFWVWRAWRLHRHIPKPPKPKITKRSRAVGHAVDALAYHGRMIYTEGPGRSQLFNRRPGDFLGAGADCSQFVSAIMHWVGVKSVNQWDATGTLLGKGREISQPRKGAIVIFGPGGGVHTGMFVEEADGVWYLVEFGEQAAPDKISLPNAISYFERTGHPGVRFRDFF